MLMNAMNLKGLMIRATDGDLGTLVDPYFDDETWAIRYFTVDTGSWLGGRRVLISPMSVLGADWQAKRLDVSLTKKQVEDSPSIDTQMPVSRQHEAEYLGYYGFPNYWDGPYLWGPSYYPVGLPVTIGAPMESKADVIGETPVDTHLRSADAVTGYNINATDGEIGHVCGFIVDDEAWAIRYLEVDTRNWWPGKKVLFSPEWAEQVSWLAYRVYVALSRDAIQTAPAYDESMPITREYEDQLHLHYGRPPYWLNDAERRAVFSLTRT